MQLKHGRPGENNNAKIKSVLCVWINFNIVLTFDFLDGCKIGYRSAVT